MQLNDIGYYLRIVKQKIYYISIKCIIDIIVATILFIILLPLMIIIAIMVKITSRGPALYGERRIGIDEKEFIIFKFRSMINDEKHPDYQKYLKESADGTFIKPKNNPRITKFGRFLRRTSLDELPQLYNVIIGEMSLVGPRPSTFSLSGNDLMRKIRAVIKPGVTGLWQIENRENCLIEEMIKYDIEYIEKFNFWYDLQIILKTIPAVLSCRGAY